MTVSCQRSNRSDNTQSNCPLVLQLEAKIVGPVRRETSKIVERSLFSRIIHRMRIISLHLILICQRTFHSNHRRYFFKEFSIDHSRLLV